VVQSRGSMETTSGTGDKPRRVIKRYSNRKLYDTKDSRYVTLQQIGEMVRAGEEVQIIDNATKEDKTEVTLALIISEDLKSKPRSVPLGTLRDLIQERGERLLTQLREGPIGRLIPGGAEGAAATGPTPTPIPPPPAPAPETVQSPSVVPEGEKGSTGAKARLTEIVESSKHTLDQWQHQVDERIRAILPGFVLFRELEADVKHLTQRVEELEARLSQLTGTESPSGGGAPEGGSIKKE
jgi:polyhydroxyalkanoate synthesis repressor PhaR